MRWGGVVDRPGGSRWSGWVRLATPLGVYAARHGVCYAGRFRILLPAAGRRPSMAGSPHTPCARDGHGTVPLRGRRARARAKAKAKQCSSGCSLTRGDCTWRLGTPYVEASISLFLPDRDTGSCPPWMQGEDAQSRPWMAGGRIWEQDAQNPAGRPPPAAAAGGAQPSEARHKQRRSAGRRTFFFRLLVQLAQVQAAQLRRPPRGHRGHRHGHAATEHHRRNQAQQPRHRACVEGTQLVG